MRIVKLSKEIFNSSQKVEEYFKSQLWDDEHKGKFFITETKIRENGIDVDEVMVFSYLGKLKYWAKSASSRITLSKPRKEKLANGNTIEYPFAIEVNPSSVKPLKGDLMKLNDTLKNKGVTKKSFAWRGWTIVEENLSNAKIIETTLEQFAE